MTPNRDLAKADEEIDLLGLDHPFLRRLFDDDRRLPGSERAFAASSNSFRDGTRGLLAIWHVILQDSNDRIAQRIIPLGVDPARGRSRALEIASTTIDSLEPATEALFPQPERSEVLAVTLPEILRRDLAHKGQMSESVSFSARLLAWIEFV